MDVKTTLLNETLQEDMHMTPSKALRLFIDIKHASSKSPFMDLNKCQGVRTFVLMRQSKSLFFSKKWSRALCIQEGYVDDIMLTGNDTSILQTVKVFLSKNFSMKD